MSTGADQAQFHFWCTDREDAEHTYEELIRSFEWFVGVPVEVLVDNQKCVVVEHRADGPRFNARFLDTTASRYGRANRRGRGRRTKTNRWSAISSTISSCRTAPSTAGRISISSPSSGCARKRTSGSTGRCGNSWPSVSRASSRILQRPPATRYDTS